MNPRKKKAKAKNIPGQPPLAEFVEFARSKGIDAKQASDQWEIWDVQEWRDGNGKPILMWKGKLLLFAKRGFGAFGEQQRKVDQTSPRIVEANRKAEALERQRLDEKRKERQ
jgi:hypothetical protein